ncbi:MAG TPA: hypothetical protein VHD36_06880 [Pirellulales bacterium]|nr:hypothetical protein [Pirellulales bacterium]
MKRYVPPRRWPVFSLSSLLIWITMIAVGIGSIPLLKRAVVIRRYMEIHYSIRKGDVTEDYVKDALGDEYVEYRRFVDSLSD